MTGSPAEDGLEQEVEIEGLRVYHGPNPHDQQPVVVARLMLDESLDALAADLIEKLRAGFNKLALPASSPGESAGREALAQFAVEFAHAVMTQSVLDFEPVGVDRQAPDTFDLFLGFFDEKSSRRGLSLAVRALTEAKSEKPFSADLSSQIAKLGERCARLHPNFQGDIIRRAATAQDLPVASAWDVSTFRQFGWGAGSELVRSATSNRCGYIGANIVEDKIQSKHMITQLGLPTPRYSVVREKRELADAVAKVGFPCVVKPPNLFGGAGITTGITSLGQAEDAFDVARTHSRFPVLVETFVQGQDHRLLVTGYKLRSAMRKTRPSVTGDGRHTIAELTEILNASPDRIVFGRLRGVGDVMVSTGDSYHQHLAMQGLTPNSVPRAGQTVTLQGTANQSTGGSVVSVLDVVHPHVRIATESMARTLQAEVIGFDYMTTDISKDWTEVPGNFIEMNLSPGLVHLVQTGYSEVEAGQQVVGRNTSRIPLKLAVLPQAILEEAQAHFAKLAADRPAGIATHAQAWFDRLTLDVRPGKPWAGVITLLGNRALESAIVLAPSEHVQRHGMPVDRADRIWLCDEKFPDDWLPVLDRTTRSDVRKVDLATLKQELRFD